jgi:aspartyl-tRNA(Asn)/glutamyl-tRNA(Gln) amidotransferase subunit A
MIETYPDISSAHTDLLAKKISVLGLVESALSRAIEKNKEFNIFREIFTLESMQGDIVRAQEMIDSGSASPLCGIPCAIKDNILYQGHAVGASSKILENYIAPYSATVVEQIRAAGAIIIGRTNMDEYAMGSSTENSAYGVTKNPHNTALVAGGSSGGSAAAVAARCVLFALGTDTGGSVRQPAAFCGIVGMMPSYGTVSRYGLIAMGSSLDQAAPFTHTTADSALVYKLLAQPDIQDATTLTLDERKINLQKKKILGVPMKSIMSSGVDKEIQKNFLESLEKFKSAGYIIREIDALFLEYALAVYYVIMPAEVSSNLARFDGIRYGYSKEGDSLLSTYIHSRSSGFGEEVKRRILIGTYILSHGYYDAYYTKALSLREKIKTEFKKLFDEVDVVLTPTTPTPAFKIGEKSSDPLQMYLADIFTVPVNIAQIPALVVPSGKTDIGLPLSLQFIGPRLGEDQLFDIAKEFETMQ